MIKIFVALTLLLSTFSLTYGNDFPVILEGTNGESISSKISKDDYIKSIDYQLNQMDNLISHEKSVNSVELSAMKLKFIIVGLGFSGNVGLGPISVGAGICHRLWFSNK